MFAVSTKPFNYDPKYRSGFVIDVGKLGVKSCFTDSMR